MKTLHLVIITVFLITATMLLTTPRHAYASTCAVKETIYSAPEFFLLSDNVFVGNVTSITDYGNHQWQVHFNIEKIWKGTATRQTSTVMTPTLQACGYSITVGEKYLIYTNGSPSTINPIFSKMYSDAQNDIALFDDPKFQSEEKIKEDLNKKLEVAEGTVGSMMMDKSSHIPVNAVGVDQINSTLDITIDDEKATLSIEQYTQNLKTILGDIPIKVAFGHSTAFTPILHNANDSGLTTSNPIIPGSNSSNVLKSPLKQFKSGIKPDDIKCGTNFQLVLKGSSNSPACIKKSDVSNFMQRMWAIRTARVENTDFLLDYAMTNGHLENVTADLQSKSIIFSVKAIGNGTLVTDIPRLLFDPKMTGEDMQFFVLKNGQEIDFTETKTSADRILTIPLTNNTLEIEIIALAPQNGCC